MSDPVHARGLSRRYGRVWALREVDLSIAAGSCVALVGANGAGKSTLLGLLATLSRPDAGELSQFGLDPRKDGAAIRRRLGYVGHATLLDDTLTAAENLRFHAGLFGLDAPAARIDLRLGQMGLRDRADLRVDSFSRGMRQRLTLARALLHEPALLVLDEPFTGLDQAASTELAQILAAEKARGCGIILATHQLGDVLRWVDRVVVLEGGRKVEDAPADTRDAAAWVALAGKVPA